MKMLLIAAEKLTNNVKKCCPHLGFQPAPSREQKMTKALPLSHRGIT
jgi:hypothetical protein